jgi:hypothetical protein
MRVILDQLVRWRDRGDEHIAVATVVATRRSGGRLRDASGRIHAELQPK